MTEEFYYQRTNEYKEIYNYNKTGEFMVPMIHSAVLLNLRDVRTDFLTFNGTVLNENMILLNKPPIETIIPIDDIITFSVSAKYSETPLFVSNTKLFGFIMVPLEQDEPIVKDLDQLTNIKILIINDVYEGLLLKKELSKFAIYPKKDTLTLSKIFMINLKRRDERRIKMEQSFLELGLMVDTIPAFDGKDLNEDYFKEIGLEFLTGYADPYHNRPMTMGEIGCFLSHFYIWEKMVDEKLNEVLILEDDIRFEPYFKERTNMLLNEAREIGGWDLM